MTSRNNVLLSLVLLFVSQSVSAGDSDGTSAGSEFTGETLTLLFVTDVRRSVAFYKSLGFVHDYYYDYERGVPVLEWDEPYPPEYAEMIRGRIRVGLTTPETPHQVLGGGVRHYFLVEDVNAHFEMVDANNIVAEPHEVEERPWMSFFTVPDPDNHQIVFGTKNQAYYDQSRKLIDELHRQNQSEQ